MALPSTGLITLRAIGAEFGTAQPVTFTKLYGKAAGIPASGYIGFTHFYGKSNAFVLNISASVAQPNIRSLATAAGWNGSAPLIVNITAPLINSLDLGSTAFAGGITLNVSAGTRIGGVGASMSGGAGIGGNPGSFAFKTRVPVTINNQGIISGGGGSGSAGDGRFVDYNTTRTISDDGYGGSGQGFASFSGLTVNGQGFGLSATRREHPGAVLGGQTKPWAIGGKGGDGGTWGLAGNVGSGITDYGGSYSATGISIRAAPAGAAGPAVDGNSFVTWAAPGTRLGGLIN
ncbi:hypothetical protein [Comamonas odontotermitis]|uniref:hypothetical protein n=1 Tax=Comamonas odontotermitis TaxID=379895 RepID=UPI001CC57D59|nr:hypothetical protein [Comamonas odontotermitis]UBB16128.1 hypothetical protein LAD35_15030 [Comamonas odontotermitis]